MDSKNDKGYSTNDWNGHENFICGSCQFATLDKERMEAHIVEGAHQYPFPEGFSHDFQPVLSNVGKATTKG